MKKYICYGGMIRSRHDRDIHYISASRLPQLYNVDPKLCIFINSSDDEHKLKACNTHNMTELKPRSDGKYNLQTFI